MSDDHALQPATDVATARPFRLMTPLKFLFGDRDAILTIAATPNAVFLGLLLVITAGFAREYDGEDLVREPWYLLIPVVASLVTSFILFVIIWSVLSRPRPAPFLRYYESFLSLYWLTAPLAWIYAVPVERFLSPGEATRWNLIFLLIVSVWRVLLITRVISVLCNVNFWRAFFPVTFFADIVVLFVLYLTPMPVFNVMGGIRLSDSENIILSTKLTVGFLSIITFPVWLIGAIFAASMDRNLWQFRIVQENREIPKAAWIVGGGMLLAWLFLATQTQPAQRLRHAVERDLKRGAIREALETMSAHNRKDFPWHWDPPPRVGYGEKNPPILDVIHVLTTIDVQPWVRGLFWEKLRRRLGVAEDYNYVWHVMEEDEFDRYLTLFETVPEATPILQDYRGSIVHQLEESQRSEIQRARLKALLDSLPASEESDTN